ncbi:MAG: hypothetical protein AAF704_08190 [Cyanobacteria bacterium P01_D01_bin.123]
MNNHSPRAASALLAQILQKLLVVGVHRCHPIIEIDPILHPEIVDRLHPFSMGQPHPSSWLTVWRRHPALLHCNRELLIGITQL